MVTIKCPEIMFITSRGAKRTERFKFIFAEDKRRKSQRPRVKHKVPEC